MSIKLMTLAFETPYKPSPKVFLLAVCDNANDEGICYPSIATLAKKCSIGKTNITYIAKAYETIDIVKRKRRKRNNGSDASTLYTINISKLTAVALSKGTEREGYLQEFEKAYKSAKNNAQGVHSVNTTKKQVKKQKVNTPVHPGEHLKPSINHQREDIYISPLSISMKSQESFVNYMRGTYANQTIAITQDRYTNKKMEIGISGDGMLYDRITGKTFPGTRAKEIWAGLYELALRGELPILNQSKEASK